jgi:hypothetical protein
MLPGNSYKHLDDARVGKVHVTAPAVTSRVSDDTTMEAFSRMSDTRVYESAVAVQFSSSTVVGQYSLVPDEEA